jgi:hypothetical protein
LDSKRGGAGQRRYLTLYMMPPIGGLTAF